MAVTRSRAAERRDSNIKGQRTQTARKFELLALLPGSVLIVAALALTYTAKTVEFAKLEPGLVNLNALERREQLLPLLGFINNPRDRQDVATRIWDASQDRVLPNVGAIGRIAGPKGTGPLLTTQQITAIKPKLIVRTPATYRRLFLLWSAAFLAAFYLLHIFWRLRGFRGEEAILPAIHLLCGVGLTLMVSLRDPLRDSLSFADFSQSVVLGAITMGALSSFDYGRLFGRLSYVFLIGAVILSIALILFGSGPGTSDAKVNLFGFQPVEFIKLLLVFFLAGYFATRWEFLRVLKERRLELANVSRHVEIPRLEYLLPVVAGVAVMLLFFFLQRDLGPALVITCVFVALYAVARSRALLAAAGLALLLGGFLMGYFIGYPRTVYSRVSMWLSPWDNAVRGGEQVVHALWAFATGGLFGTGLGLGSPDIMPAAHTDLILAVLGEEWGFVGVLGALLLYGMLIWLGLRIAMRAGTDYNFFLALGLTLLTAISALLIAGGVLDLFPLSGVVTPFLSYGGTAMLANFGVFGILLALSSQTGDEEHTRPFRLPVLRLTQVLGVFALALLAKAAYIQILRADPTVGAGTLTLQADGFRRFQYNPRLTEIARSIPRGTIFDRYGLPLATSDPLEIDKHRKTLAEIGAIPAETDGRRYPLGPLAMHLVGDLRTRANWGARNSSLIERDSMVRLQGYNDRARVVEVPHPQTGKPTYTIRYDYRELVPLLRHRWEPDHPGVTKVTNRKRDVQSSIDARLQIHVAGTLRAGLSRIGKQKGAAIVMDPATGDLLASVSYPWPATMPIAPGPDDGGDEMLDRARYGLYPPGSTFKIVTAMAALRKNPASVKSIFECKPLPDGRVGNFVKGWGRPIRDDVMDRSAHGAVDMRKGTVVSCNAYYAQLASYVVGAEALKGTADLLGIATGNLKDALPQAGYGQGQVVASPFQMARVAATIAAGGRMPYGRWITDESNARAEPPAAILDPALARTLGEYMRTVVTSGTGRNAASAPVTIAGKTGTAEVEGKPSHAWFVGFAPYGAPRFAFAVLVENGQYGGSAAALIARDIVAAAAGMDLFRNEPVSKP